MGKATIGFALTGSFCTFDEVLPVIRTLLEEGHQVVPIMSEFAAATDTRFGRASDFISKLELMTDRELIRTIVAAEPIGPKKLLDLLIVAPCTGNTLSKLALGIADTCVTMAAKAHLRNQRPLLVAVSTNDALSNCAKNIGALLNARDVYLTPMKQDSPLGKPRSVVADFSKIPQAAALALERRQMQPIYC